MFLFIVLWPVSPPKSTYYQYSYTGLSRVSPSEARLTFGGQARTPAIEQSCSNGYHRWSCFLSDLYSTKRLRMSIVFGWARAWDHTDPCSPWTHYFHQRLSKLWAVCKSIYSAWVSCFKMLTRIGHRRMFGSRRLSYHQWASWQNWSPPHSSAGGWKHSCGTRRFHGLLRRRWRQSYFYYQLTSIHSRSSTDSHSSHPIAA